MARRDPQERRRLIVEATWRVLLERGLESATTRAIADEASCSLSTLAHFFTGKDEIMRTAQAAVYERMLERTLAVAGAMDGLVALEAALLATLPLDERSRHDGRVSVAFAAASLSHAGIAQARTDSHRKVREVLRVCLAEARAAGELAEHVEEERVMDEFVVLVEGSWLLDASGAADDAEATARDLAAAFVARLRA